MSYIYASGFLYETIIPILKIFLSISGFFIVPSIMLIVIDSEKYSQSLRDKQKKKPIVFLIAYSGLASFVLFWPWR